MMRIAKKPIGATLYEHGSSRPHAGDFAMPANRTDVDRRALAAELAERCAPLLSPRDWEGVSFALGEMHDQLLEDLADEGEFDGVFGDMVACLIDRLGNPDIASWPQAHIYARSTDPNHRGRAVLWMKERHH